MTHVDNGIKRSKGFTLVELMLSMSIVSMLLIAIMLTIVQITNMYNKGLSMREVNQASRVIADDLLRTIGSSAPFNVSGDTAKPDNRYIVQKVSGVTAGGRLCTGKMTYLWNYGTGSARPNKYDNPTYDGNYPVRIVKLPDATATYCIAANINKKIPTATPGIYDVVDLLKTGDRNLVVHDFKVIQNPEANDVSTGQALYVIKFIIGTNNTDLLTSNSICRPPAEVGSGVASYCAVNKFEVVARAGNSVGSND